MPPLKGEVASAVSRKADDGEVIPLLRGGLRIVRRSLPRYFRLLRGGLRIVRRSLPRYFPLLRGGAADGEAYH